MCKNKNSSSVCFFYQKLDHGTRLHKYGYATKIGKAEKHLPFLSVRLPNSLHNLIYYQNLIKNRFKLIGFYDVYQTLRQFLHLNSNFTRKPLQAQYRQNSRYIRHLRGISLLEDIPQNRSCGDALIPDDQCNCLKSRKINQEKFKNSTNLDFNFAVKFILKHVKKLTENHRNVCALYRPDKIELVEAIELQDFISYSFTVIFQPDDSWFEASVTSSKINGKPSLNLIGTINRLSPYGETAYCVNDFFLRNYCHCKIQL
jgi:hypothetical protein